MNDAFVCMPTVKQYTMANTLSFMGAAEVSTSLECCVCNQPIKNVIWYKCTCSNSFQICKSCHDSNSLDYSRMRHETNCSRSPSVLCDTIKCKSNPDRIYGIIRRGDYSINNDKDMYEIAKYIRDNEEITEEDKKIFSEKLLKYFIDKESEINHPIKILSLDGGGVRGYMEIRVLQWLIKEFIANVDGEVVNHDDLRPAQDYTQITKEVKKKAFEAQKRFVNYFDYISGTSTGGLIAFCLVMDVPLLEVMDIYGQFKKYFQVNTGVPIPESVFTRSARWAASWLVSFIATSKYNNSAIHAKIDDIILDVECRNDMRVGTEEQFNNSFNSTKHNPLWYGPLLDETYVNKKEYIKKYPPGLTMGAIDFINQKKCVEHGMKTWQKTALILTAFDCTANRSVIWSSNKGEYHNVPVADALKSTMAAPTFFPPHVWTPKYSPEFKRLITLDDLVKRDWFWSRWVKKARYYTSKTPSESKIGNVTFPPHAFLDGGIYANDPELCALWIARQQHLRQKSCIIIGIGTGKYTEEIIPLNNSKLGWILPGGGLIVTTIMDANTSFIEQVAADMTTFADVKRFKLNYTLNRKADLADPTFVSSWDNVFHSLTKDPKVPDPNKYLTNSHDLLALLEFCTHNKRDIIRVCPTTHEIPDILLEAYMHPVPGVSRPL
jgi:patatin-like phospholipase/acyl hydrolase